MSLQSNNRQRGKAHQKRIEEELGWLNIGTLGGEDNYHPKFSCEAKSVKRFVGKSWFNQCETNLKNRVDKGVGVTPVVIVHITKEHRDNDIVMIKMKDFKKLIKKENG